MGIAVVAQAVLTIAWPVLRLLAVAPACLDAASPCHDAHVMRARSVIYPSPARLSDLGSGALEGCTHFPTWNPRPKAAHVSSMEPSVYFAARVLLSYLQFLERRERTFSRTVHNNNKLTNIYLSIYLSLSLSLYIYIYIRVHTHAHINTHMYMYMHMCI